MPDRATLHLVKVPLRADRLAAVARQRNLPLAVADDGYVIHCVLRGLWAARAPSPFVVRTRGRVLEAWGYSSATADELIEHAQAFADPTLAGVIASTGDIASREMPTFPRGRRIGFVLRACPVARLASPRQGHRAGAEIDVFLARSFAAGAAVSLSRSEVYSDWLHARLATAEKTGVTVEQVRLAGFGRERLVRRTQGTARKPHRLERPDVKFEGNLLIEDGDRFLQFLSHGIGRHRAFGFGALLVVPPGTSYPR